MDHFYSLFGGSVKILMDNRTEFKNQLFKKVVSKLSMEFFIHSPPYRSNRKIEGFHIFLKAFTASALTMDWNGMSSYQ